MKASLLVVTILISTNIYSLETNKKTYKLNNFLQEYLSNSKNVEVQKLTKDQLVEKETEAKSGYLPSTSLVNYTSKTDKLSGEASSSVSTDLKNQTYVKVSQNIFNGFKNTSSVDYAKSEVSRGELDLRQQQFEEINNALELFYNTLKIQRDIKSYEEEIATNEKNLAEVRKSIANGNAKRSQLLSIQTTLAGNKVELLTAKSSLNDYLTKLNVQLNTNLSEVELINPELSSVDANLEIEKRPDYLSLKEKANNLNYKVTATEAGRLPTVDVAGNYYLADNSKTSSLKNYYSVGLTVNIPFPFGYEARSQVNQAKIDQNVALVNQKLKYDTLNNEKNNLANQLETLKNKLVSLEEALNLANENAKYLKREYSSGLSSYIDYLSASTTMYQTQRKFEESKIDYELTKAKAMIWSGNIDTLLK